MSGYILESRTILDSAIWDKPPLYFKVWHYLLLKAQHVDYKGLKRGQLITSIPEIQEACSYHVGYRKITPSKKEIYGIVKFLRNPYGGNDEGNNEKNMIVTTKVTHGLLVTICNYNVYQDPKNYEGNDEKSAKVTTKSSRRERQGNNINKNDKNDKNDKNEKNYIYSRATHDIIQHLNERTGSQYKPTTKKTKELIQARMNEGFTVEDFKTVIDKKCVEWMNTEWQEYLRPVTLFGTKFESYLNAPVIQKQEESLWERIARGDFDE